MDVKITGTVQPACHNQFTEVESSTAICTDPAREPPSAGKQTTTDSQDAYVVTATRTAMRGEST